MCGAGGQTLWSLGELEVRKPCCEGAKSSMKHLQEVSDYAGGCKLEFGSIR